MFQQRNISTVLRGSGVCLAVVLLAVVALLCYTNLASAQQTSTEATLSAPELTAEVGEGAIKLSWTSVTGAERYQLWVWTSADDWQQIGGDNLNETHTDVAVGTT